MANVTSPEGQLQTLEMAPYVLFTNLCSQRQKSKGKINQKTNNVHVRLCVCGFLKALLTKYLSKK